MIPFIGPSYQLATRKADVQRSVNLYPVVNEVPGGKTGAYLEQIPGLDEFSPAYVPVAWESHTLPLTQTWQAVIWARELGIFVAVGTGDKCVTSIDGLTWTQRNMPSSAVWARVIWAPQISKFVAVATTPASTNKAAISSDGITWSAVTLPISAQWSGLAWNGSKFCLMRTGVNNRETLTSPDGTTWTNNVTVLPSSQQWEGIAWSPVLHLFCAVAGHSTVAATSPDGLTWTARVLPANLYWREIVWGSTQFVITAYDVTNIYATSSNGTAFSGRTFPISTLWGSIAWNQPSAQWCAVGQGSIALLAGPAFDWRQTTMVDSLPWYTIAAGGARFAAFANSSNAKTDTRVYE